MATQVPNTNTFTLQDVVAVVGGTDLATAFSNSTDSYFDTNYKGSKNELYNFRNYTVAAPPAGANYGYWAGGYRGAVTGVVNTDRMTFSTGVSAANAVSNLTAARYGVMAISNGSSAGYWMGGIASSAYYTTMEKITFSTGITAANSSNLPTSRAYSGSMGDGANYGYFGGGSNGTHQSDTYRLTFSTNAVAAHTGGALSVSGSYVAGISDGTTTNYGYFAGRTNGTRYANTDRINFSTGAVAANAASYLSVAAYSRMGLSDGTTYGYFAAGNTGSYVSSTDRIVFSTSVTSAYTSSLSATKTYHAGISSGSTYGYYAGGYLGSTYTNGNTIDRVTFSSGVFAANPGGNLSNYNGATSWAFFAGSGLSEFRA